jgi:predicted phosphodiesterase
MRTLIVSDLHLGSRSAADVLRSPALRAPLLEAVADVDRVVLLGDVLELRHGPMRDALAAARPFFEALGGALGEREIVVLAGNHDHALVDPWLARRGELEAPPPLGLEQLIEPAQASAALERVASWVAPAPMRVAYPGLWIRPDVYATHGHYLDSHITIPTLERLSVGAMARLLGKPPSQFGCVGDYEAVGAPMFAWRDTVARDAATGAVLNGATTVSAWDALRGTRARKARIRDIPVRWLRRGATVAGFSLTIAALNRAGIGPLRRDISMSELRRAGLRAMGEVAARLQLGDAYVVFGHTHRPGPLAGDAPEEWRGRAGARLINTGSWTYSRAFVTTAAASPYWPGTCVLVDDHGPPTIRQLLQDRTRAELESGASSGAVRARRAPA